MSIFSLIDKSKTGSEEQIKRIIRKCGSTFSSNNNFKRVGVKERNLDKQNDMNRP